MKKVENKQLSRNDGNTLLAEAISVKPILFSTEMVRAIKKGEKLQTRRIAKWSKNIKDATVGFTAFCDKGEYAVRGVHENGQYGESIFKAPIQKGDILWVRETFSEKDNRLIYRADVCSRWDLPDGFKWKPSLFMPKKHCRIFLEVTKVRIEKLQNIKDEDCIAEGIKKEIFPETNELCFYFYPCNDLRDDSYIDSPKTSFYSLWKSINGQKSWDENPFVFVYDFKVVDRTNGFC